MNIENLDVVLKQYLTEHPWFILLIIWIIIIKGFGLWYSAKQGQKIWFVAILIVNSLGILELIYLASLYLKNKKDNSLEI